MTDERTNKVRQDFFETLDELTKGERTLLKRACGKTLEQSGAQTMLLFYNLLPRSGVRPADEEKWFAAACLHCLEEPNAENRKPLAEQVRNESRKADNSNLEKRICTLMELQWDDEGYFTQKLLRLVKYLKQKGYQVDCNELLQDLCRWNYEGMPAQKNWARQMIREDSENAE